jgi:hypothetical protein
MKKKKNGNTGNAETSIDSLKKSEELSTRLRERILDLARKAGRNGLTINEAERQIGDHKGHSVSPRFSELVRQGALVRVPVDHGRPTKHCGVSRWVTRYDEETGRSVTLHWIPACAPAPEKDPNSPSTSKARTERSQDEVEDAGGNGISAAP